MHVNKQSTSKFYETFAPCNCGECRYFVTNIETAQPEICTFLRSLAVDPLKPYELLGICCSNEKKIEYADCAYLVVGQLEENFQKTINGIQVTVQPSNFLPKAEIDEDYFFVSFGPLFLPFMWASRRHLTVQEKFEVIKQVINKADPLNLIKLGCPKDEYSREALMLAKIMANSKYGSLSWKQVQSVFEKQFDEKLPKRVCVSIVRETIMQLDMVDFFKDFSQNELLKDRVSLQNDAVVLKVHDNFVVESACNCTYINGKFYFDIEDQDLLECLCDFVTDDNTVYVQYKHKHFGFHYEYAFRYFKEIPKRKFSLNKLKHFEDVELVFDNKQVIYSAKSYLKDLSKQQIVQLMYNQPISCPHEKVLYAPDKMSRLIVFKENNIYSYERQQLTILDDEERRYSNCYAIWEPYWGLGGTSKYDSQEHLLADIAPTISNWEEHK